MIDRCDLLLVGGMTVDRFTDGAAAPGGSVLHAAPAAIEAGRSVAVITAAGFEPEVQAGLSRLSGLRSLQVQRTMRSIEFEHRVTDGGRELRFHGSAGVPIVLDGVPPAAAVLLAPVADELDVAAVAEAFGSAMRAAILQGWLRRLVPGEIADPVRLAQLPADLRRALAGYDLLVASREDLLAESGDPVAQLDALRAELGERPVLVVTAAEGGVWIDLPTHDDGSQPWNVPVPRLVGGVPTVGAGDIFAALLVCEWPDVRDRASLTQAAATATRGVADRLERRR